MVSIAVLATSVWLLVGALIVKDGVSGLIVTVGGVFDQGALGFLETLGLAAAGFADRAPGRVALFTPTVAADLGCFSGGLLGLLLLIR
jgi:hypothetical protein